MRIVLNLIWLVLAGVWLSLGYFLAAILCFILIVTIPFGFAALRISRYALWPFGRTLTPREDAGAGALLGNILWLVLFGWWLALEHLLTALALFVTIIGIPLALANLKLIPVSLAPLGRRIVSTSAAVQGRGPTGATFE